MEPNGLSSGMFPSISTGLLGVENPSKQQQQQQNLQNQHNPHHLHHHSQIVSYVSNHDTDTNPQQSLKHGYNPFSAKTNNNNNNKPQSTNMSDEDDSSSDKRKVSPWHRMKWTDAMVRLLIMAVYYIGDEAGTSEGTTTHDSTGKKKVSGLMLQKKGKWKSVSRAMMEKGFYVSPQQCEDKFNDLNKRYKRVNDILGKGTACRVVENQNLMDTMDLSPKLKEEVRKLLNSKHLFFREMCAYHNSCGHGSNNNNTGSNSTLQQSAEVISVTEPSQSQPEQQQQQQCFHSSENGVGNMRILKGRNGVELEDDSDESDESGEYSEEEEDESNEVGSRGQVDHEDETEVRKRIKKGGLYVPSSTIQNLSSELNGVVHDGGKSVWEKKVWMKKRMMQLEEQKVSYEVESFELEKQRLRWVRYSSKKERGMERDKLENERKRLENERMVLIIRQMEVELMNVQKQKQQQQQHSST
ncbi:hypothetical protein TanjilG_02597 [Lupinus angustifolius]|uniref:Myb/SANT-like DNA-binding domain-containing protein n=1 Tax=Lupinus angustifolius TaxID=3871 RepID=A0A4P1R9C3_LUPAN|nr:PREDICTED: lateral signaling target protein 2 homolog [Lupinus angustifolius]OIW05124.1 hypothetical protein TanjilG_02597 [Lupinus angustifolius]